MYTKPKVQMLGDAADLIQGLKQSGGEVNDLAHQSIDDCEVSD
jgi:hypothetical protein